LNGEDGLDVLEDGGVSPGDARMIKEVSVDKATLTIFVISRWETYKMACPPGAGLTTA
jgi:hypothetical protein